jgi:hypothetical protein
MGNKRYFKISNHVTIYIEEKEGQTLYLIHNYIAYK